MACAVNGDIIYLFLTEIQQKRKEKRKFMENLNIKGIRIGRGRPVICIPVVAEGKEEIISRIRELGEKHTPMINGERICLKTSKIRNRLKKYWKQ